MYWNSVSPHPRNDYKDYMGFSSNYPFQAMRKYTGPDIETKSEDRHREQKVNPLRGDFLGEVPEVQITVTKNNSIRLDGISLAKWTYVTPDTRIQLPNQNRG